MISTRIRRLVIAAILAMTMAVAGAVALSSSAGAAPKVQLGSCTEVVSSLQASSTLGSASEAELRSMISQVLKKTGKVRLIRCNSVTVSDNGDGSSAIVGSVFVRGSKGSTTVTVTLTRSSDGVIELAAWRMT